MSSLPVFPVCPKNKARIEVPDIGCHKKEHCLIEVGKKLEINYFSL